MKFALKAERSQINEVTLAGGNMPHNLHISALDVLEFATIDGSRALGLEHKIGTLTSGLYPLGLMLPIDETSNPQDASAWSAMAQSGGYVIGTLGPMLVGWIRDTTQSYTNALMGLIVICIIMIVLQFAIGLLKTGKYKKT